MGLQCVFCVKWKYTCCNGVARAFTGGRLAHPEGQNEEEKENFRKNEERLQKWHYLAHPGVKGCSHLVEKYEWEYNKRWLKHISACRWRLQMCYDITFILKMKLKFTKAHRTEYRSRLTYTWIRKIYGHTRDQPIYWWSHYSYAQGHN